MSGAMIPSHVNGSVPHAPYGFYYPHLVMPPYHPYQQVRFHVEDTALSIDEMEKCLPRLLPQELPTGTSSRCDICWKDYSNERVEPSENAENAVQLPCGHFFGEVCIFEWVRRTSFQSLALGTVSNGCSSRRRERSKLVRCAGKCLQGLL